MGHRTGTTDRSSCSRGATTAGLRGTIGACLVVCLIATTIVAQGTADWTVLVYLDGDNNLEGAAIDDLNEMEAAGSTVDVHIVVQLDRIAGYDGSNGDWTTCKRFYVTHDPLGYDATIVSTELADLGEVNMGDPATLIDFAEWGRDNFPANHYALVLWDHGNGWKRSTRTDRPKGTAPRDLEPVADDPTGIGWDDTDGGDYITTPELRAAFQSIHADYGSEIDIVGLDACLMGMLEIDYDLAPYADYRVASEETEPWDGWDYEASMTWLVAHPAASAEQLAQRIVADYLASYGTASDTTQSAVDLAAIRPGGLAGALHTLAHDLRSDISAHWFAVERARDLVQDYYDTDYIDLYHFAELLRSNSDDPTIQADAQAVMNAIAAAVAGEAHGSALPNSHGISIYFPSCDSYAAKYDTDCLLSVDTDWNDFVYEYCGGSPGCGAIDADDDFETGDLSYLPWIAGGDADWFADDTLSSSPTHSARSGDILDDQTSFLEVTCTVSEGNVLFCYKVSSEEDYDFLRFYVDGEPQWSQSGEEGWSLASIGVSAGLHTFRWAYEKDHSLSSGSDAAWIDDVALPDAICLDCDCLDPDDDFETGDLTGLPWTTGGAAAWSAVDAESSSPTHSARSGDISDGESTYVEVTREVEDGNVLFCYKVSSEPGFDFLRLYIDGEERWARSGEQDWMLGLAAVTAGTHTFRWTYEKDGSLSSGSDAAWIDDVQLPDETLAFGVEAIGDVRAERTVYAAAFESGSADVAEWVPLSASAKPADVLVLDPGQPGRYRPSSTPCSPFVAGVVSSGPGLLLGTDLEAGLRAPLALVGIVPVRVTDEGGPIAVGDLLVTSSTPGHAMRWSDPNACPCALIGKALEPMTEDIGTILVLLTVH